MKSIAEILQDLETRETGPIEPYPDYRTRLREAEIKHKALIPFEIKGRASLLRKYPEMRPNYSVSLPLAKNNYGKLPFGPRTKAAYNIGLDAGKDNYDPKIIVSHEKCWAVKWMEGVSK